MILQIFNINKSIKYYYIFINIIYIFIEPVSYTHLAVVVEETRKNDEIILKLTVSQDDMGKVIGKQGRIAKAIRTVVRSAANREKVKVSLEIV